MKNRHGVYYYINGDKYEGEWKHNRRHGRGKYYYKSTGLRFIFVVITLETKVMIEVMLY